MRIGKNIEIKCLWVDTLETYLKEDWPNFKPDPDRLEKVRELMESGVCLEPVEVVCSRTLDKCRIKDGRHRIVAAKEMGREKLLTLREYVN